MRRIILQGCLPLHKSMYNIITYILGGYKKYHFKKHSSIRKADLENIFEDGKRPDVLSLVIPFDRSAIYPPVETIHISIPNIEFKMVPASIG